MRALTRDSMRGVSCPVGVTWRRQLNGVTQAGTWRFAEKDEVRALRVLGRRVLVGRLARLGNGKRSPGTGAATEAGELVKEESEKS